MPALSIRDYLYALLLTLLVSGFAWYTIHERHVGQDEIVAADTRTALVAQAKDAAIQAAEQASANSIGAIYEKAVSVPAVGDLGVVCVREPPRGGAVPPAAGDRPAAAGAPVERSEAAYDPSGAALTVGRDDDALIRALQAQVLDMVSRMNGSAK